MSLFVTQVIVIMLEVEEQEENEKKLEARYQKLVAEPGPHSPGLEILGSAYSFLCPTSWCS